MLFHEFSVASTLFLRIDLPSAVFVEISDVFGPSGCHARCVVVDRRSFVRCSSNIWMSSDTNELNSTVPSRAYGGVWGLMTLWQNKKALFDGQVFKFPSMAFC